MHSNHPLTPAPAADRTAAPVDRTREDGEMMAAWQVRAVLAHMEAHLAEPLVLDELAQVAGISRFHFSRCFRNAVGEPPLRHLARMRIAAACRLLRESPAQVTRIAEAVGYRSPQAFARAFERTCGCTPSAYRTRTDLAVAAQDDLLA